MKKISNFLTNFVINDPLNISGLTLYPINFDPIVLDESLLLLDDCFDNKLVQVFEVSQIGNVEKIGIKNNSNFKILIIDGEAIVGAKQNRIAQSTIIIEPNSEKIIPVNCVEKGRWSETNDLNFSKSEFSLSPKMRDNKAALLKDKNHQDIQANIWNDIDRLSEKYDKRSSTEDLGEVLLNLNNIDNKILDKIEDQACNGYFVIGTQKPFIEIFYNNDVRKHHIRKNIKSWIADLETSYFNENSNDKYLSEYLNARWLSDTAIGAESAFKSVGSSNGRSYLLNGKLIHSYYFFN